MTRKQQLARNSQLMRWFNIARAYGRQHGWDDGRTNRAFGLLQRADGGESKFKEYNTRVTSCECRDVQYNKPVGGWCLHRRAKAIQIRAGA